MISKSKYFYINETEMENITQDSCLFVTVGLNKNSDRSSRVKILVQWEEPERTVTLTESEFNELVSIGGLSSTSINFIRSKLFGDKNE